MGRRFARRLKPCQRWGCPAPPCCQHTKAQHPRARGFCAWQSWCEAMGGVAIHAGSDGRMPADTNLAQELVDLILDSALEGIEKPDPRFFQLALDRSGAQAERTVHVGDLYHVDVTGARAAGRMTTLLLSVPLRAKLGLARSGPKSSSRVILPAAPTSFPRLPCSLWASASVFRVRSAL